MSGRIVLLLSLLTAVFSGCNKSKTSDDTVGVRCPDTTLTGAAEHVCRAFAEFPPTQYGNNDKVSERLLGYFTPEMREAAASLEGYLDLLYGESYLRTEDFSDLRVSPAAKDRVRVRFRKRGTEHSLEMTVRWRERGWEITDVLYPDNNVIKHLSDVIRPHIPDLAALRGDYFTARARYAKIEEQFPAWEYLPDLAARRGIEQERTALVAFLENHLDDVLDPLNIPGFRRSGGNNLVNCMEDGTSCLNIDGRTLVAEDGTQIVVTHKRLLQAGGWPTDPGRLSAEEALAINSWYLPYGDIPVIRPDSVQYVSATFGLGTQDGTNLYSANSGYLVAAKGDLIFLVGLWFSEPALPELPECRQEGRAKLQAHGFTCDEYVCRPPDSTHEDEARTFEAKVEDEFQKCYTQRLPQDPSFPKYLQKVQGIVDRIAAAR
jgi:hypothetical protein